MDNRNQQLFNLWVKYADACHIFRAPMPAPSLAKEGLLFVGVNPSWTASEELVFEEEFGRGSARIGYPSSDAEWFVRWENARKHFPDYLQQARQLQERCLRSDRFNFFRTFRAIAARTSLEFQHVDIAFFRETQQGPMPRRHGPHRDFWLGQLKVFWEVVDSAEPRVIVIANRGAAKILQREYADRFETGTVVARFVRVGMGRAVPLLIKPYPGNGWQQFWDIESVAREVAEACAGRPIMDHA